MAGQKAPQRSTDASSSLRLWATRLGLTCSAAVVAEAITYPIDVVKTRLQLQGELASRLAAPVRTGHSAGAGASGATPPQHGALRMALEIVRREGAHGLYAGLPPALLRHIMYTGTRITMYEQLRSLLSSTSSSSSSSAAAATHSTGVAAKLVLGLTAGAVGQAVAVPADLIKVRLQAEGRLVASGKLAAPRYKGMADVLRQVVAANGVAGLWRGGGPAIQRAALVNLGELATYDQAKELIMSSGVTGGRDNLATHTASSVASGFFASLVSVPADVVKTRMMSQDTTAPLYRSSLDCLVKSVRAEGLAALYKGFLPTWARLGPWQLVFWTSYEQFRQTFNMGGF